MVLLESVNLPLGAVIPEFSLPDAQGSMHSFESIQGPKAIVVVFMCNHCPYVQKIWPELVDLSAKFRSKGVNFVGINPNVGSEGYDEETPEKMIEYSQKFNMNFLYLNDAEQIVAKAFNAQCTPDIYVYDAKMKLAYHGRIGEGELKVALEALVDGKTISDEQHPSIGCSIKWK